MPDPLLLYGATGFTGRLILADALRAGLRPLLGGRDAAALAALAEAHGLAWRVARLDRPSELDAALAGVRVVLHAAGPFADTAAPMLQACLRAGAHYLDITGEAVVLDALARSHQAAQARGVMVLPGVGFDVVPSDCLALHVARRLPGAERLVLAVKGLALSTRGSARTLARHAQLPFSMRRDGCLTLVPTGSVARHFDFGGGPERCLNVAWGDIVTAFYSTGIPTIEVFFDAHPLREALLGAARSFGPVLQLPAWQVWLDAAVNLLPVGPTPAERAASRMVLLAEAWRGARAVRACLQTPEAYTCTAAAAAAIAARVVGGDHEPGFQTPARLFGADFVLTLPDVTRSDLPDSLDRGAASG